MYKIAFNVPPFIGGIIMLMLGLIGEYIGRIYISLNNSPQYVVRKYINYEQNVRIGKGNHFEMGVTVSHDCKIGDFNFFAPGAVLCGDIKIGKGSFIGANSTLRNSITIVDYVLVGAGAYVDRSIASEKVIVPSRSMILDNKTSEDFMKCRLLNIFRLLPPTRTKRLVLCGVYSGV